MMKNILSVRYAVLLSFLLFFGSLAALQKTDASHLVFLIFDVSWLLMLLNILIRPQYYIYFFSVIMLFLGFWVKYLSLIIFEIPLIESVGHWQQFQSKSNWDHVLLTSSLVALGLLSANLMFWLLDLSRKNLVQNKNHSSLSQSVNIIPKWYKTNRVIAWGAIIALAIVVNTINVVGKIYVTGVIPKWILPFHLNAVIFWIMSFFVVLVVAIFVDWDRELQVKGREKMYFFLPFLACITSITVLSRAIYLFWTLPYLFIIIKHACNVRQILTSIKKYKLIICWYMFLLFFSLIAVSTLRTYIYQKVPPQVLSDVMPDNIQTTPSIIAAHSEPFHKIEMKLQDQVFLIKPQLHQVLSLLLGRWIGLEAIMATTVYPNSGINLFLEGIKELPRYNGVGMYSEKILSLSYNFAPGRLLASLPGLAGILNYSHSFLFVYGGVFLVMFVLCLMESIVYKMLRSELLIIQQGLLLAYWCVSGLNIPYLGLINMLEVMLVSVLMVMVGIFYKFMKYYIKNSDYFFGFLGKEKK